MARARRIEGPYELHPQRHLITAKDAPDGTLQRAGHGQMVETPEGVVYHTHLCSRPMGALRRSPLGRETAIQRCVWREDDWLYLADGGVAPSIEVEPPSPALNEARPASIRYAFSTDSLPSDFQWLRTPLPERIFSLSARPGWLRLIGRESIGSWFEQALVARRQEDFAYRAETRLDFAPTGFQQAAGLALYYNRFKFHFLAVTADETLGRVLTILSCADYPEGRLTFPIAPIALRAGAVKLAASVNRAELRFAYADGGDWTGIEPALDASLISDEAAGGEHRSFTGAFVGMAAFDVSGAATPADFEYFTYERREP